MYILVIIPDSYLGDCPQGISSDNVTGECECEGEGEGVCPHMPGVGRLERKPHSIISKI